MLTIQATGKSVDAAIFNGLNQLGLSIDEVNIEVIQHETKGILGIGAKPAIVKLIEKPKDEVVIPDFSLERERRGERRDRRDNRDNRERRDNRGGRDSRDERRQQSVRAEKPAFDDENAEAQPAASASAEGEAPAVEGAVEQTVAPRERREHKRGGRQNRGRSESRSAVPVRQINYTEEAAANEPAARFVGGLIEKMCIEGKVLAAREDDAVRLRIDCGEMGVMIGHRGETLDAVQYLTGLVINKNRKTDGYTRVTINTEDYREKREETLIRLARRIASQVKSTGAPRTLEPMNPYERRIIHSALQKHPYVTTHSEGDEPNRCVVVSLKRRDGGYRRQRSEHA